MTGKQRYREKSLGTISPADIPVEALPVVVLDEDQLRRAAAIAYDRNGSYRRINGGDVYTSGSIMSHLIGVVCEMAVASAYSTSIDEQTYRCGDDGTDFDLLGKSADIKGTATLAMERPELLVRADNDLSAEIYFLAHIIEWRAEHVRVRLHGYAPKAVVTDREPRPYPYPDSDDNYVVTPEELALPPWTQTE